MTHVTPDGPDATIDPGPVAIHARNVHFDFRGVPLQWIPGHPVASHIVNGLNLALPEGEHWFVEVFNEAVPYITDEHLLEDVRGFVGQEYMHAQTHDGAISGYLVANGIDVEPALQQIRYLFRKLLAPAKSSSPRQRYNNMVDRIWLVAALEHYTAVLGDFVLNCTWDEHQANPTVADMFRWHGAEEVEHRSVAHDVAMYFRPSYFSRFRAMVFVVPLLYTMLFRLGRYLYNADPETTNVGQIGLHRKYFRDARLGLVPRLRFLITASLTYFRPSFTPEEVGSTAQAVAYLAQSPAAQAVSG